MSQEEADKILNDLVDALVLIRRGFVQGAEEVIREVIQDLKGSGSGNVE